MDWGRAYRTARRRGPWLALWRVAVFAWASRVLMLLEGAEGYYG